MTTVAVRGVTVDVKAPTLDDIIRGVIAPVQSSGASITFRIPSWVEVGDLIRIDSYNRTHGGRPYPQDEPVTGWHLWENQSDYAADYIGIDPIDFEFAGSTWHMYYHVVVEGDAGDEVTFDYVWGGDNDPITFGNPIICGVVFKGDYDIEDGNYGGVGYDYDYDDAAATHTKPYQLLLYFNGLYGGGNITPPPGASVLCQMSSDSSVLLSARVAIGGGSTAYHITPGAIGIWAVDSMYSVAFA